MPRQQWEYRLESFAGSFSEKELNRVGAEGWEIAYVRVLELGPLATATVVFKRPKEPA